MFPAAATKLQGALPRLRYMLTFYSLFVMEEVVGDDNETTTMDPVEAENHARIFVVAGEGGFC